MTTIVRPFYDGFCGWDDSATHKKQHLISVDFVSFLRTCTDVYKNIDSVAEETHMLTSKYSFERFVDFVSKIDVVQRRRLFLPIDHHICRVLGTPFSPGAYVAVCEYAVNGKTSEFSANAKAVLHELYSRNKLPVNPAIDLWEESGKDPAKERKIFRYLAGSHLFFQHLA